MSDPVRDLPWGAVPHSQLERVVVVSPHFDDGALGAAHLMDTYRGTTVITTHGGKPPSYPDPPSDWDASGGFKSGDDVVETRREEDREALSVLGARSTWLDFSDHQYLERDKRTKGPEMAPALEQALRDLDPTSVFLPMGIANPDHVSTHEAGLIVREKFVGEGSSCSWFGYEDQGYKHLPGLLAWRIAKLFKSNLWPTPAAVPVRIDMPLKRSAIWCYKSQIAPLITDHALEERLEANVPEQYWRLDAPPPGWEALTDLV